MQYNVELELNRRRSLDHDDIDAVMEALAGLSPTIASSPYGRPVIVATVEADSLAAALTVTAALCRAVGGRQLGLSVLPTAEWDRRAVLPPVPPLLSVTQAAERLGVSPQRVRQRIQAGTLAHVKVGDGYVIPAAAINHDARTERANPQGDS